MLSPSCQLTPSLKTNIILQNKINALTEIMKQYNEPGDSHICINLIPVRLLQFPFHRYQQIITLSFATGPECCCQTFDWHQK